MKKSSLLIIVSLLIGCFYVIPVLAQGTDANEITTLNAVIPDFQVNENAGSGGVSQLESSIAFDANGNFVITWRDQRNGDSDIYAQRYSHERIPLGINFKVNDDVSSSFQSLPVIAVDTNGTFLIIWRDNRNGDYDIYAQLYSYDGTKTGSNSKVNDDEGSARQGHPSVAVDQNGIFFVTWRDNRNGEDDIYAQRFLNDGSITGSNFEVYDDPDNTDQVNPSIAGNSSGNFVIAWRENRSVFNSNPKINAQRFLSDGTAVGSVFKVEDFQIKAGAVIIR